MVLCVGEVRGEALRRHRLWGRVGSERLRQDGGGRGRVKGGGSDMVARCAKGQGTRTQETPRLRRREQKKGRGVLRFWVVLLYRVFRVHVSENSCANPDSSHLAVDLFTDGRDETRVALTALSYSFSFVCVYLFVR